MSNFVKFWSVNLTGGFQLVVYFYNAIKKDADIIVHIFHNHRYKLLYSYTTQKFCKI